jgi:radical SAM superfamily enzyme YgiQ (UPF0313 family)
MKNVLFLFPPCIPSAAKSPYLAPHLLSTILREKGHGVENIDLNNRFVRKLANLNVVREMEKEFLSQVDNIEVTNHELKFLMQSGISHSRILRKKLENGESITLTQMIANANYIKDSLLVHQKTVQDYRDKGLDILSVLRNEFNQMVDELDIENKVVCISCAFGDQLPFSFELARLIKKKSPSTKILLGGAQVSLLPEELLQEIARFKLFNLVFTGFAEEKISEAIEACPDSYFTEPMHGSTATTPMLDALPYTHFDEFEHYENPMMPVLVNKGCYWGKCSFCDYILMGDLGGFRYISRTVKIVFDEIKNIRERYPDCHINLISDAVPPKFYKELAMLANQENFPLNTHSYMINNKNLTEDFFIEASKAKIGTIVFGTESTNDRILDLMKKQGRRKDILENFRLAKKYGVSIKVNLIPNYPTTTYREAVQTVNDIVFFQDSISQLAVFRFYLSANTHMDKNPESYELDINNDAPYLKTLHNGFHSREFTNRKGMTKEEEEQIYFVLRTLAIKCQMNEVKHIFKNKFGEKKLKLNNDFEFVNQNGQLMVYSFQKGTLYNISQDDYQIIQKLVKGESTPEELNLPYEWLEKFYFFRVVEFAA